MMPRGRLALPARAVVVFSAGLGLVSTSILVIAACAVADETGAPDTDAQSVVRLDGSSLDGSEDGGSVDADPLTVPCASGSLCRVATALTLGAITSIHGRSKADVWASGSGALQLHWNGQQWSTLEADLNDTVTNILVTPEETWGISGTLVVRRDLEPKSVRTARVTIPYSIGFRRSFSGIAVLANQEAYVAVAPGFRGTNIRYLAKLDFDAGTIALQPDAIHPTTGAAQSQVGARALFLVPERAVWLVGDRATVIRYPISSTADGGSSLPGDAGASLGQGVLVPVASQADLFAAWAYEDHLWAAGWGGTILHFDGAEWHVEETTTTATLNAIFGVSPKDIWAAGDNGTLLHYDGNAWSPIRMGTYTGRLTSIWGATTDDVWIGGEGGMFHWGALP